MQRYLTARTIAFFIVVVIAFAIGLLSPLNIWNRTTSTSKAADIVDVCAKGSTIDTPAYKQGTQQAMALYTRDNTAGGDHYKGVYTLGTAPQSSALHEAYTTVGLNLAFTNSQHKVPVTVGCIARNQETPTGQVCHYDGGKDIPVYTATYHLDVYEGRTHNKLLSKDIPTLQSYTCQSFTAYDGTAFYRSWDGAVVATELLPFAQ